MMLLALLATIFVCPDGPADGATAFVDAVAKAQRELGVYQQLYVEVVPKESAITGINRDGDVSKAIAWIDFVKPRAAFNNTIYVRYDMFHAMDCDAIRVLVLHEVCHIKLQHYLPRGKAAGPKIEAAADECAKQLVTPQQWLQWNANLQDAAALSEHEPIEPPAGWKRERFKVNSPGDRALGGAPRKARPN